MLTDELAFWDQWPRLLPLYEALRGSLAEIYADMEVKVSKSQISFYNRHMFAMASPPVRRKKGWPKEFVLVSFGLPRRVSSPRIAMSVEAYPNRWTHHVIVAALEDIDGELLGWLKEAYDFSAGKR